MSAVLRFIGGTLILFVAINHFQWFDENTISHATTAWLLVIGWLLMQVSEVVED